VEKLYRCGDCPVFSFMGDLVLVQARDSGVLFVFARPADARSMPRPIVSTRSAEAANTLRTDSFFPVATVFGSRSTGVGGRGSGLSPAEV
jgi:hypothetical protein